METLADFGTVAAFNYDTFTTAIYKTWFSLFSFEGAMQLSAVLATVVLLVALLEQQRRSHRRFVTVGRSAPAVRVKLKGMQAVLAVAACGLVLLAAFAMPMAQLVYWSVQVFETEFSGRYLSYLGRSLFLAGVAALLIVSVAVLFGYRLRGTRGFRASLVARIATLGYALPGPVIAVGFFAVVAALSNALTVAWQYLAGAQANAVHLQGTALVLFAAYLARFFAVGFHPVESAFSRVGPHLDEAAGGLGASRARVLTTVHLPLLRGGILTGAILAFVDVLKDMPITLMLRPFGWETLATRVFELTSEGEYARAALPSVAILLAGLVPVLILMRGLHAARN
jgi:iron(III) transport system permease protein